MSDGLGRVGAGPSARGVREPYFLAAAGEAAFAGAAAPLAASALAGAPAAGAEAAAPGAGAAAAVAARSRRFLDHYRRRDDRDHRLVRLGADRPAALRQLDRGNVDGIVKIEAR